MRNEIRELVERPGLVLSDDAPVDVIEWAEKLIDSFQKPARDDEAVALLDLLSRSDDTCFGLNWEILHFIESAPSWPILSALEQTEGAWAENLKTGLRNAEI